MLSQAIAFNSDLAGWNVASVSNMDNPRSWDTLHPLPFSLWPGEVITVCFLFDGWS